jgi:hypothetical protein
MLAPILAFAGATATAAFGTVEVSPAKGEPFALVTGQRVESGATIKTLDKSSAVLRFDDGQSVSISGNTTFVITDYKFNPQKPAEGNFAATLLRGAIRTVTGVIGETNKQNVSIKTSTATMGIRGTDFMLSDDGRLYIQVIAGAVSATNSAGVGIFSATNNPIGMVTSSTSPPRPAQPSDLPANTQGFFRQLSIVPLTGQERKINPSDPSCGDRR